MCPICGAQSMAGAHCLCPPGGTLAVHRQAQEVLSVAFTAMANDVSRSVEERNTWRERLAAVKCVLLDMEKDATGYMALILAGGHLKLRAQLDRFPQ